MTSINITSTQIIRSKNRQSRSSASSTLSEVGSVLKPSGFITLDTVTKEIDVDVDALSKHPAFKNTGISSPPDILGFISALDNSL